MAFGGSELVRRVRIPQESQGACRACGQVGLLGDGLCVGCADSSANRTYAQMNARNLEIAKRMAAGELPNELAREFHVGVRQILRIVNGDA